MQTTVWTMKNSDWSAGFNCEEHGEPFCFLCKPPAQRQVVYISAGGSAYHKHMSCNGLTEGQEAVKRAGGVTSPIEAVTISGALRRDRIRCLVCWSE